MIRLFYSAILFFILIVASCTKKTQALVIADRLMLDSLGLNMDVTGMIDSNDPCLDASNYIPDENDLTLNKVKTIRLIFHIMNSSDSSHNFTEERAPGYFWTMLNNAQERLLENRKMNLPEGNNTPVLSPLYKYKKVSIPEDKNGDGFLYHYDDELYYFLNRGKYRNNYSRDVIEKYKVGDDTLLNIFVMPHHPDSVASTYYKAHGSGIALGNSIKVAGIYENGGESWRYSTLINHEIGHVMGLKHSWIRRDGCDDTPPNANCYSATGEPPCEGPTSNNMMDYNNSQMAITPCQLGIMHKNMSTDQSLQRKLVIKDWCKLDTSETIVIDSAVEWKGEKDVYHNIIIEKGGQLSVYCRLSMPQGSSIIVQPGGKLFLHGTRLHNDCEKPWKGIQLISSGKEQGEVYYSGNVSIEDIPLK